MAPASARKNQNTCCCSATADKAAAGREHAHAHDHAGHIHGRAGDARNTESNADSARDPVCGMTVDPHKTPHRQSHAGHTYYFCSAGCRDKFSADPAKYLAPSANNAPQSAHKSVPPGTIYTCP